MNNIPFSFLATLPAPPAGASLGEQLAHNIAKRPRIDSLLACLPSNTRPAILSPSLSRPPLTYAQLRHAIATFRLPSSSPSPNERLGRNDRVAVVLPTGPENALAILSISAYHTCAPINASCTAQELLEDGRRLRIKAIVTTADAEQRLELHHLRQKLGCEIIYLTPRQSGPAGLFELSLINQPVWQVAPRSEGPSVKLHGLDDYSLILHTSGTSGKKKVVPYTLRSLIIGTLAVVKSWALRPDDVNMNMMPLFHVGGIIRNLWAPVFSGGSTIMCSAFDAATFWTLAQHLGATWYYAAPTMHHAILASRPDDVDASRDTRIRLVCNAAGGLLPTLAQELRKVFGGCTVLPSYGMTECMPIASPPPSYRLERPGTSGVACGPHLSIRNPANIDEGLAVGTTGAICVRGLPTFKGYEVSPDSPLDTSAFSKDGWFDSGDCGWMDADGYLYITGRSKEIINKGGEVISPFEIEEAVMSVARDRIRATLAFSIEHDVLQEHIGLIVVPALGQPLIGLAELHDRLREHLHPTKWPFVMVFMTDLPKNDAGKPLRIGLAPRLKLGAFSDDIPTFNRHFQAQCPPIGAPLSQPIDCSMLVVNEQQVVRSMKTISGIRDVALRVNGKNIEAFASVFNDTLDSKRIGRALINVLPGYAIPAVIHVWAQPILRLPNGKADFDGMESELQSRQASIMTHEQTMVRDIIARLLSLEPKVITADSDFFLLGGNSMLVGRLAYAIRKETGMDIEISALFTNSTVRGIASMLKGGSLGSSRGSLFDRTLVGSATPASASTAHWPTTNWTPEPKPRRRGWTHPLSLIVQSIPFIFFYPLKLAWKWTIILFVLSYMHAFLTASFWPRAGTLLFAIFVARGTSYILTPITAIIFKWVVIGYYKPGVYPMWSTYHLRWWIVNQALLISGRGIFAMHPALERIYMQLLGARVGSNVRVSKLARFGEYDLLDIGDNCLIDKAIVRGFCVERDGYFRLGRIMIGDNVVINTYTQLAPDTIIMDNQVFGPHASSHDDPSDPSFAIYNSSTIPRPKGVLTSVAIFVFLSALKLVTYIPWFTAIYIMISSTILRIQGLNNLESVIWWFADPERVLWHAVGRVMRAVVQPLLQVFLGIVFKRLMGLNRQGLHADSSQWSIIRRYINSHTLSQSALRRAFDILGSHYQMTTWIWRAMGARVGKRVYWPGSGIACPDPELLEIGDDVVFGSRSELLTSDGLGSGKIKIEAGAMIADRVVLLPGTHVGSRTVMGSGSLSIRDGYYPDGSTWMGAQNGEAVCLSRGAKEKDKSDTITPFGRAFYNREADYFVFPYILILFIGVLTATLTAVYWSISAVAVAQVLRQLQIHARDLHLFRNTWYRFGTLYGFIAVCFICVLNIQAVLAMAWAVLTKWLVIGRRQEGSYVWDKSSYCQRWQLHLTLSSPLNKGFGNLGVLDPLTGTVFMAWYYRAIGAKIGDNCSIGASGHTVLMTEPDLVELGNNVSLDDCSVVAHINSRGIFTLNRLQIGNGCALRSGSRLLSGASMEENSMLLEHTLLASGEIADAGEVYVGWPARRLVSEKKRRPLSTATPSTLTISPSIEMMYRKFNRLSV